MRKMFINRLLITAFFAVAVACSLFNRSGNVKDEALEHGYDESKLKAADEDYFHDMDGGLQLTTSEVRGRNNWIAWTAGNDRFWDLISTKSVGTLDFLKTISSRPGLKAHRSNRFQYQGLINEPCFAQATEQSSSGKPSHANRYGLWLDVRQSGPDCPPDPFENEAKYPGVQFGARGKNLPVGSYYGWPTGIVGLRLFPNPAFDETAEKKWSPEKYFDDPNYYNDKDLIKPYRVGMSCGFCHVGPHPLKPPVDPENPKWENLSSNVGAQYFWVDRVFAWQADASSFAFQLFHTSRPGALDTSLVSTDYINNPRTMNAVYGLSSRLDVATKLGKEKLAGGGLNNAQFPAESPLCKLFVAPDTVFTPHVLKDGADSAGALGALNRVFLNIGLFSEEWLTHFNALVGGKKTTPIEIAVARKNSAYWLATESQTPDLAAFFLRTTGAHLLKDAPGGADILKKDAALVERGKVVFAEYCARCHSSKLPDLPEDKSAGNCAGPGYLDCWNRYWTYTKTSEYKAKMREIVLQPGFLDGNYLSTELRIPVTLLQTQACSPVASNGIGGSIWDNFTSKSYKDLPSPGSVTVHNPIDGKEDNFEIPAGGRGYTRPPSLISAWSTAPFLLNNTVGNFEWKPDVASRIASFNDSMEKMLWPEKREHDSKLGPNVFLIDRTTAMSFLRVSKGYLPELAATLGKTIAPDIFNSNGDIEIGPIPKGTPVSLLSNIRLIPETGDEKEHFIEMLKLLSRMKRDLIKLGPNPTEEQARQTLMNLVGPALKLSACPDFEVNRGHYFGTAFLEEEKDIALSNSDKRALIAFIRTF